MRCSLLVPKQPAAHADQSSPLSQMAEVLRIGLSRPLRGLIALSLVSLAASLVLRGLWGGPWLMEIKALGRIEAGNVLGLFTLALIAGPVLMGILDRTIGHRREVLAATPFPCRAVARPDGRRRAALSAVGTVRRDGLAAAI